jgi:hypothetical protein
MGGSQAIVFRNALARRFQLKGDWQAARSFFAAHAMPCMRFHTDVISTA